MLILPFVSSQKSYLRRFNCQVILIMPLWSRRPWLTDLFQLAIAIPKKQPNIQNLQQPNPIQSKSRHTIVNCIASIDRGFKEICFSKNTRALITANWRAGTQKDYACKFRQFDSWCSASEIDPYSASLVEIVCYYSDLYTKVFNIGP